MTRPCLARRWWFLATFGALALLAALTADGQTCPPAGLPAECTRVVPCPYPTTQVPPRQDLPAGPWVWAAGPGLWGPPRHSLGAEYAHLDTLAKAVWPLPGDAGRAALLGYMGPEGLSAYQALGIVIKRDPDWPQNCCHEEALRGYGRFERVYGSEPTMGQWWNVVASRRSGRYWTSDSRLLEATRCAAGRVDPEPEPSPEPPPPPPPLCTPYAGSSCEARCVQVGKDREWCLSPERETGARHLFNLCTPVCRDGEPGEPEPEPEPEPEEPTEPELECWTGTVKGHFIPGIPSTGRLEVELFRVDCPPVEGGGS